MPQKQLNPRLILLILVVLLILGAVTYYLYDSASKKAVVDLYGTSINEATAQIEGALFELREKFGDRLKVNFHLVSGRDSEGKFVSFVESSEPTLLRLDLEENKRQLVIKKYFPKEFETYLKLRNERLSDFGWEKYAQAAEIDPDFVQEKIDAGEGDELLNKEIDNFEKFKEENPDLETIPALYINGEKYEGLTDTLSLGAAVVKPILRGRKESLDRPAKLSLFGDRITLSSLTKYHYGGFNECYRPLDCNDKPDKDGDCANVGTDEAYCKYTDPAVVHLTVLSDDNCLSCGDEQGIKNLKKDFKGIEAKTVDIDTDEGREIIKEAGARALPVYLFDESVKESKNYGTYIENQALIPLDEAMTKFVVANVLSLKLFTREFKDKTLDLFVMSYCPFSGMLEKALIEKLNSLPEEKKFTLNLHYVLAKETKEDGTTAVKLESLRGEEELAEDKRQVIIQKYFPEKFFAYLLKRNEDLTGDWKKVCEEVGIDTSQVESLISTEGESLLLSDAQFAFDLGISGSPGIFWENQQIVLSVSDLKKLDLFNDLSVSDAEMGVSRY